jgi:hypothetical protein
MSKLSGRELDVAVAEHVMGWREDIDRDYSPPQINWVAQNGAYERVKYDPRNSENVNSWGWQPSKSIADAMQVVEKMRERGFGVRVEDSRTVNASRRTEYDRVLQDGGWQVGFLEPEREDYNAVIDGKVCYGARQIFSVTAATLPEAICRAALAVMGSTVSHISLRGGVTFGW